MDASATSSAVSTFVLYHITLPRSVRAAHYPQPPLKVFSLYFLYAVGSRVRAQREFVFHGLFSASRCVSVYLRTTCWRNLSVGL